MLERDGQSSFERKRQSGFAGARRAKKTERKKRSGIARADWSEKDRAKKKERIFQSILSGNGEAEMTERKIYWFRGGKERAEMPEVTGAKKTERKKQSGFSEIPRMRKNRSPQVGGKSLFYNFPLNP